MLQRRLTWQEQMDAPLPGHPQGCHTQHPWGRCARTPASHRWRAGGTCQISLSSGWSQICSGLAPALHYQLCCLYLGSKYAADSRQEQAYRTHTPSDISAPASARAFAIAQPNPCIHITQPCVLQQNPSHPQPHLAITSCTCLIVCDTGNERLLPCDGTVHSRYS